MIFHIFGGHMRICILTFFEDLLLRDTGPTVRIYNLAKGLASLGHKVHIIIPHSHMRCKSTENITIQYVRGFFPLSVLRGFSRLLSVSRPASLFFYDIFFLAKIIQTLFESDIVQIEEQEAGGLLIPILSRIFKKKVIVDCHDVFQALRVKHTTTIRRILETFAEKIAYNYSSIILTVSEKERKLLISYGIKENKIYVIPNGANVENFDKTSDASYVKDQYGLKEFHIVVFVGNIDFLPNKEAVRLINSVIAPRVHKEIANVKFLIIGRTSEKMETINSVIPMGKVKDVRKLLLIADVAIAPLLRGSGTKLKILEYFSCSLPVVSTSIGVEGLDAQNGVHAIIEDDIQRFGEKIVELLKNEELRLKLGKAARELVINKYDWKKIVTYLNVVYQSLLLGEKGH